MYQQLRKDLLQRRRNELLEDLPKCSQRICHQLLIHLDPIIHTMDHKELCLSGFYPIQEEPNILPVLEHYQKKGIVTCLPIVQKTDAPLIFRTWQALDTLSEGSYKVMEPTSDKPECWPDILLVPLLGFHPSGARLGYGKGYYDRTLDLLISHNKASITIGITWDICELPTDYQAQPHDIPMNYICTDKRWIQCTH